MCPFSISFTTLDGQRSSDVSPSRCLKRSFLDIFELFIFMLVRKTLCGNANWHHFKYLVHRFQKSGKSMTTLVPLELGLPFFIRDSYWAASSDIWLLDWTGIHLALTMSRPGSNHPSKWSKSSQIHSSVWSDRIFDRSPITRHVKYGSILVHISLFWQEWVYKRRSEQISPDLAVHSLYTNCYIYMSLLFDRWYSYYTSWSCRQSICWWRLAIDKPFVFHRRDWNDPQIIRPDPSFTYNNLVLSSSLPTIGHFKRDGFHG